MMFIYVLPVIGFGGASFATLLVIISLLMFFVGSINFNYRSKSGYANYSKKFHIKFLTLLILFVSFLILRSDVVSAVLESLANGTYSEMALANAIARYEGEKENLGVDYQLGTVALFAFCILLPWVKFSKHKMLGLYACLLFMIIIETSTLGRAGTVLAISALFANLLIRYNHILGGLDFNKVVAIFASFVGFVLILFLYTAVNRLGASDEVYEILFSKFGEYIFAVYAALLTWLESVNYSIAPATFGFDTFTGFFKFLGFTVPQGTYLMINTEFGTTNIYSFMRGLYSDIGYIFVNLFFILFGYLAAKVSRVRSTSGEIFLVQSFLYMVLYFVISPYSFTTFLIASIFGNTLLLLSASNK
jgi:oligosaccharide repeat unit polymerase